MTMMAVRPNASTSDGRAHVIPSMTAVVTSGPVQLISKDQAYFWSVSWQEYEQLASEELEAGNALTFTDPADALKWLQNDDD